MIVQQRTQEDSSVLWDTVMTETGRFGYTAFRPDTLHMTVHLDSVKHEQQQPRFALVPFLF